MAGLVRRECPICHGPCLERDGETPGDRLRDALRERGVDTAAPIVINPADTPIQAPDALLPTVGRYVDEPPCDTQPLGCDDYGVVVFDKVAHDRLHRCLDALSRVRALADNINAGYRTDETIPRNLAEHIFKAIDGVPKHFPASSHDAAGSLKIVCAECADWWPCANSSDWTIDNPDEAEALRDDCEHRLTVGEPGVDERCAECALPVERLW